MKVYIHGGHICTDVEINFNGKKKILHNMVLDTGAVQSIIDSGVVKEMGITAEYVEDFLKTYGIGGEAFFFRKKLDSIKCGDVQIDDIIMDFMEVSDSGDIQGLIGLDLLKEIKAVIDVEIPEIRLKGKR